MAQLSLNSKGGSPVDSFNYTYDADGNVLSKRNNVLSGQSELYGYDGLNRLSTFSRGTLNGAGTAISGSTASQSWTLDALGNGNPARPTALRRRGPTTRRTKQRK